MPTHAAVIIFIGCFLGIIATAFLSIEAIKTISEKFNLSKTFIGAVFLSLGTSFPEFINSLIAGVNDRGAKDPSQSANSFYNITGANVWQIVFLSFMMIFVASYYGLKKDKTQVEQISQIFWKDSMMSWRWVFLETTALMLMFIFPNVISYLTTGGFNWMNLMFFLIWVFYIIYTYKTNSVAENTDQAKYFTKCNKLTLSLITLALWTIFGGLSYVNFMMSEKFAEHIGKSASFGVLLSFVTSTPEFSVMYLLFKQKEYKMAVSGFFGSSIFNLTLPTYSNLISLNTIFGKEKFGDEEGNYKITMWLFMNIIVLCLFLLVFWKHPRFRNTIVISSGCLIVTVYLIFAILSARIA